MNKLKQTILAGIMANIIMLPAIASATSPLPVTSNNYQLQNAVEIQDKNNYLTQEKIMKARRADSYGFYYLWAKALPYRLQTLLLGDMPLYYYWDSVISDLQDLDRRHELANPQNFDYKKFNEDYYMIGIHFQNLMTLMHMKGYIDDTAALEFSKYLMMPAQLMLDNRASFELWNNYTWEELEEAMTEWQSMVDSGIYNNKTMLKSCHIAQEWVLFADAVH